MRSQTEPLHQRENHGLLTIPEKRALTWLAERMPHFVTSDHLTGLGLMGMLLAGLSYWAARWNSAALFFVALALGINWFGDSLDGTLARVRDQQRPRYGYYTDHVLDLVGTSFLLGGLALSGFMNPLIALGLLVAYMMVTAEVFLATHVCKIFRMSFLLFGPTELRIILAVGTLFLVYKPHVYIAGSGPYRLFDIGGMVSIAGLALAFLASAFHTVRVLYREEPLPQ
jgi:archaetidylinositol phosphate synthase